MSGIEDHKDSQLLLVSAEVAKAELHNKATRVRDLSNEQFQVSEKCPCCKRPSDAPLFSLNCRITELGQLGVGYPLFFFLIKTLILILTIGSLLVGIACAANNYNNNNSSVKDKPSNWATAAALIKHKDPVWQCILHLLFCLVIITGIIMYRKFLRSKITELDELNITPSDFGILVRNLPRDTDYKNFEAFISENAMPFGERCQVACVSPAYAISDYVSKMRKLKKLKFEIAHIKEYKERNGSDPKQSCLCFTKKHKSINELNAEIEGLTKWKESFDRDNNLKLEQGDIAFVMFYKQSDNKQIIDYWKESSFETLSRCFLFCLHNFVYSNRVYRGNLLRIEQAPEPSDIIWENLSVKWTVKLAKRLQTAVVTTILICMSFTLVVLIKDYEYKKYHNFKNSGNEHISNSENLQIKFISFMLSFTIQVLNIIIGVAVRIFSSYEKHNTWTAYNVSVFHKLVISTTLNTILVLFWVNSYAVEDKMFDFQDGKINWFKEEYGLPTDLYNLLLIDAILTPIMQFFSPIYMAKLYKRRQIRLGKKIVTQEEANQVWTNPEMDLAQRSARYIRTLLVVLIFSPLFPLGFFLGLASLLFQYWADKILLLRRYSWSKQLGKGIALAVLQVLPVCLLCYSISTLAFFYESHTSDSDNKNHKIEISALKKVIPSIVGVCIVVVYFFIPFRKIFGKAVMAEEAILRVNDPADDNLTSSLSKFKDDYLRTNPVISKSQWEKWYNSVINQSSAPVIAFDQSAAVSAAGLFDYAEHSAPMEEVASNIVNFRSSGVFNGYSYMSPEDSSTNSAALIGLSNNAPAYGQNPNLLSPAYVPPPPVNSYPYSNPPAPAYRQINPGQPYDPLAPTNYAQAPPSYAQAPPPYYPPQINPNPQSVSNYAQPGYVPPGYNPYQPRYP